MFRLPLLGTSLPEFNKTVRHVWRAFLCQQVQTKRHAPLSCSAPLTVRLLVLSLLLRIQYNLRIPFTETLPRPLVLLDQNFLSPLRNCPSEPIKLANKCWLASRLGFAEAMKTSVAGFSVLFYVMEIFLSNIECTKKLQLGLAFQLCWCLGKHFATAVYLEDPDKSINSMAHLRVAQQPDSKRTRFGGAGIQEGEESTLPRCSESPECVCVCLSVCMRPKCFTAHAPCTPDFHW